MADGEIQVARKGGIVVFRVIGRATFKLSRDLREYSGRTIDKTCQGVIFDLASCGTMDSTFMGVLAMIGIQGRGRISLVIVNASPEVRELMDGIGLSKVWTYANDPVPEVTWRCLCKASAEVADMAKLGQTVLAAHQTLMALDEQNIPKFHGLVELLSKEVADDDQKP